MQKLDLWQKYEYTKMKPGLKHIRLFLEKTGNPQEDFDAVHIAGTNGKGSTAKMLASILTQAGYKCGLFLSPHLQRINERISINSKEITQKELSFFVNKYSRLGEKYKLTFFEFLTGLAFQYFSEKKIDIAVLETGLGGRFDATNIVKNPLLSIITDIDYDHTQILGPDIESITREKAGILKRDSIVICGAQRRAAVKIIRTKARIKSSKLLEYGKDFGCTIKKVDWKKGRQLIDYRYFKNVSSIWTGLLGSFQAKNSSMAVSAAYCARELGYKIDDLDIQKALNNLSWHGRFEVVKRKLLGKTRTFILDGAHNPGAAKNFLKAWALSPWARTKKTFIFGALKDKDYKTMLRYITPWAKSIVIVPVISERAVKPQVLVEYCRTRFKNARVVSTGSLEEALSLTKNEIVTVITGSLYLVGQVLRKFNKSEN
jgi:dihydrofolate synthase / folylpolyglutamate synthase